MGKHRAANQYDFIVFCMIFRSKFECACLFCVYVCPFSPVKYPSSISHQQFGDVDWFIEHNSHDEIMHIQPMVHKNTFTCRSLVHWAFIHAYENVCKMYSCIILQNVDKHNLTKRKYLSIKNRIFFWENNRIFVQFGLAALKTDTNFLLI